MLIKNAEALEKLVKIDTLVIDKTGTLTQGKPVLTQIIPCSDFTQDDVLRLAAAVEHHSEHPLARAILTAAKERHLPLENAQEFLAVAGKGAQAIVNNQTIAIGNQHWLSIDHAKIGDHIEMAQKEGATILYMTVDTQLAALFLVSDPIKPTSKTTIEMLQKKGIDVVMLTGDHPVTAHAVANQLGINQVIAEVLPEGKSEVIAGFKKEGKLVAMAGDGVNDAIALAQADIGIAMGTGSDVAIESAGVTLLRGDLSSLLVAHDVSKATVKNIHQNLFFAFVYNVLGVPIAAGILYPATGVLLNPMIAGAAMALSSVSVIINALRLRWSHA